MFGPGQHVTVGAFAFRLVADVRIEIEDIVYTVPKQIVGQSKIKGANDQSKR